MKSTKLSRRAMAFAFAAVLASSGAALAATCNVPTGTYPTIQSAINDVNCSLINVAAGTYTEQLVIGRSLHLAGVGPRTVIKAPSVLAPDADGFRNIVEVRGGATAVTANDFTVAGPVPGPCGSISGGITVIGGALLDIDDVNVSDTRDEPLIFCRGIYGIRVGTQFGGPADVGHLIASRCLITGYQAGGIHVGGPGTTAQIHNNKIQGTPSSIDFSNGIVVTDDGLATIDHNTISGNHCTAAFCGPNWFGDIQSFGIILFNANSATTISSNTTRGNDAGIDSNISGEIDHNNVSDNSFFGLVLEGTYNSNAHDNTANGMNASCPAGVTTCDGILVLTSGATVGNNDARNNGHNGIEVGAGAIPSAGNTLKDNTMTGNGVFDANDHTSGAGTAGTANTWSKNGCNTSSPAGLCT